MGRRCVREEQKEKGSDFDTWVSRPQDETYRRRRGIFKWLASRLFTTEKTRACEQLILLSHCPRRVTTVEALDPRSSTHFVRLGALSLSSGGGGGRRRLRRRRPSATTSRCRLRSIARKLCAEREKCGGREDELHLESSSQWVTPQLLYILFVW